MLFSLLLHLLSLAALSTADRVFTWSLDWVMAAPDGFARPVIGVNGKWPPPILEAIHGEWVTVTITNNLGNETSGMHWHGNSQIGTPDMDGVPFTSQCPIPPGGQIQHRFQASPAGSHWYHSHSSAQYPDGIRAPMIYHDPAWEASLGVAAQYVLSVSDWYHEQAPFIVHKYLQDGVLPPAQATLMNDGLTASFDMVPGNKYLFRLINIAAVMTHMISFEGHRMTVVAVDGATVISRQTDTITLYAGQRYDVVITAMPTADKNYQILSRMVNSLLSTTGTLKYTNLEPAAPPQMYTLPAIPTLDDITLQPGNGQALFAPVTREVYLDAHKLITPIGPRDTLGNTTYISPKIPSLYTAMSTLGVATNPQEYGLSINPYVINRGDIVQVVIETHDFFAHPFHLHGHRFQVLARGPGAWDGDTRMFPAKPVFRDTTNIVPFGHLVLRFRADNPGVWPIHCHMEWHVESGMRATFIESPMELQKMMIPETHKAICAAQKIATAGNCAGLTTNLLDSSTCNNLPEEEKTWGSLVNPPPDNGYSQSSRK